MRRHAVRAVRGDRVVVVGAHVVERGRVGDRALDERRDRSRSRDAPRRAPSGTCVLHAVVEERVSRRPRTSGRARRCRARGGSARRPASGPKPNDHGRSHGCFLPSTRLTSSSEKNRHVMSSPIWLAHVADPERRLVGVRAHRVEVELHRLGHRPDSRTAVDPRRRPTAKNPRNSPTRRRRRWPTESCWSSQRRRRRSSTTPSTRSSGIDPASGTGDWPDGLDQPRGRHDARRLRRRSRSGSRRRSRRR